MLPGKISFSGVDFELAPAGTGKPNAMIAKGQVVDLPTGTFNRVYVLAASAHGDQRVTFQAGDRPVDVSVQDWGGFVGQWDTRLRKPAPDKVQARSRAPGQASGNNQTHDVALRKDWAVSANHATWDLEYRDHPTGLPAIPTITRVFNQATSSARILAGTHRTTTLPKGSTSPTPIAICSFVRSIFRQCQNTDVASQ